MGFENYADPPSKKMGLRMKLYHIFSWIIAISNITNNLSVFNSFNIKDIVALLLGSIIGGYIFAFFIILFIGIFGVFGQAAGEWKPPKDSDVNINSRSKSNVAVGQYDPSLGRKREMYDN